MMASGPPSELAHTPFKSNTQELSSPIRIPLPKSYVSKTAFRSSAPATTTKPASYNYISPGSELKLAKLQRKLRVISLQLVAAAGAVVALSYALVRSYEVDKMGTNTPSAALEICVLAISLYQIVLIVLYWDRNLLHKKLISKALGSQTSLTLRASPRYQVLCGVECVYHLILPYSGTYQHRTIGVFGTNTSFSLCDALFAVLSLRFYHLIRLLYWLTQLPSLRVQFHSVLWDIPVSSPFRYKYFLALYDIKGVGLIYGLMVVVSGFVLYGFEHPYSDVIDPLWDNSWVVALTQTTIGYGDVAPTTLPGQLAILVSCIVGTALLGLLNATSSRCFSLSSQENDMYLELTSRVFQKSNPLASAVLIQRWWRLLQFRKRKVPNWKAAVMLHTQLVTFRLMHVRSQNLNFTRFERQIELFKRSLGRNLKATRTQLKPNINIENLVGSTQTIKLYHLSKSSSFHCKHLLHNALKLSLSPEIVSYQSVPLVTKSLLALPESLMTRRRKSSERLAVAKNVAFHNLLIRRFSGSLCNSSVSAESAVN